MNGVRNIRPNKNPSQQSLQKAQLEKNMRELLRTPVTRRHIMAFLDATETQVNNVIVALRAEGLIKSQRRATGTEYWIDDQATADR